MPVQGVAGRAISTRLVLGRRRCYCRQLLQPSGASSWQQAAPPPGTRLVQESNPCQCLVSLRPRPQAPATPHTHTGRTPGSCSACSTPPPATCAPTRWRRAARSGCASSSTSRSWAATSWARRCADRSRFAVRSGAPRRRGVSTASAARWQRARLRARGGPWTRGAASSNSPFSLHTPHTPLIPHTPQKAEDLLRGIEAHLKANVRDVTHMQPWTARINPAMGARRRAAAGCGPRPAFRRAEAARRRGANGCVRREGKASLARVASSPRGLRAGLLANEDFGPASQRIASRPPTGCPMHSPQRTARWSTLWTRPGWSRCLTGSSHTRRARSRVRGGAGRNEWCKDPKCTDLPAGLHS